MDHIDIFSRILILVIICFCAIFNLLVIILDEDLEEDLGSWIYNNYTLTRRLVWPMLIASTLMLHPH